jgi:hypothetical protein
MYGKPSRTRSRAEPTRVPGPCRTRFLATLDELPDLIALAAHQALAVSEHHAAAGGLRRLTDPGK